MFPITSQWGQELLKILDTHCHRMDTDKGTDMDMDIGKAGMGMGTGNKLDT